MKVFFKKAFDKVPAKVQKQFYDRLRIFMDNKFAPVLNNHSVDPTFPAARSINITGDYRALFIEEGDDITFVILGTHSELYS